MKLEVNSKELYNLCSKVQPATAANGILPVLSCFKMEVFNELLTVSGTDLHSAVIKSIEVSSDENFEFCIDAKLLCDTLDAIPEQPITIKLDDSNLIIKSAQGEYSTSTGDHYGFPEVSDEEGTQILFGGEILSHIRSVKSLAGNDDLRIAMTGMLIESAGSELNLVTTDAHALGLCAMELEGIEDFQAIANPNLYKHLNNNYNEGDVEFTIGQKNVKIKLEDGTEIYTQLIDKKYPDYRQVMPKEHNKSLVIDKREFLGALNRVSLFSNKTTNAVTVDIDEHGKIQLSSQDLDFGNESNEIIQGQYTGGPIRIGINAKLAYKVVSLMEDGEVRLDMSDPNKAIILTGEGRAKYLIMPVMTQA